MDGYLQNVCRAWMVMFGQGKAYYYLLLVGISSCNLFEKKEEITSIEKIAVSQMTKIDHDSLYNKITDTLTYWVASSLGSVEAEKIYSYKIDSLICLNTDKTRLICARHLYVNVINSNSDDLQFLFGERIMNKWYFFKGPSIVIPREMVPNHPLNKPLNYQQLHQIALKEVYGGYLKADGTINENYFTSQFEDSGWGNFDNQAYSLKYLGLKPNEKFTDKRKFFEAIHLQSVKNNWYGVKKDTIKKENVLP